MGRAPCCSKVGLRRGPWSAKEDALLANFIQKNGEGQWRSLPKNAGLLRCGKSCRLRWMNYLRPGIKRGNIEEDEEDLIVRLHGLLGNRWSLIAGRLPGRTDNEIKNYWNTHLLKKLQNAGIQTRAHKDLPRPTPKGKKNPAAPKKKGKKKRVVAAAAVPEADKNKKEAEQSIGVVDVSDPPPKTKVYVPKPIRVSQAFPRTESYDSLANVASSGGTSSGGWDAAAEVESYVPVSWPPLFELEEAGYGISGVLDEDDFLGLGCLLPVQHHLTESIAGDADDTMLMQVYDEYQQLIQRTK